MARRITMFFRYQIDSDDFQINSDSLMFRTNESSKNMFILFKAENLNESFPSHL